MTQRPRVSAAVLSEANASILMVQHQRQDGSRYWQLPGGGVLPGESPEHAVLRELHEETGLYGQVVRWLFTIPYKYGASTTFLVAVEPDIQATLGTDPEDANSGHKKLVDVAWWPLTEMQESPEVKILQVVLAYL